MSPRLVVAGSLLLLVLTACGGGPAASGPAASGPAASGPAATTAAIDLSQVDVCAIVSVATAEALTGETGFTTDGESTASQAKCFWGVPRPGVPQYLEVTIARRTASLQGYGRNINGVPCPGVAVSGVGAEAVGGVCVGAQTKVWLAAMDRGVLVEVTVNEPKSALTPTDLVAAANAIIAALG